MGTVAQEVGALGVDDPADVALQGGVEGRPDGTAGVDGGVEDGTAPRHLVPYALDEVRGDERIFTAVEAQPFVTRHGQLTFRDESLVDHPPQHERLTRPRRALVWPLRQ